MTETETETPTPAPKPPNKRITPDAAFESLARWLGLGLIVAGMYYDLELEREVNDLVYLIGGVLAGVSSVIAKFKP